MPRRIEWDTELHTRAPQTESIWFRFFFPARLIRVFGIEFLLHLAACRNQGWIKVQVEFKFEVLSPGKYFVILWSMVSAVYLLWKMLQILAKPGLDSFEEIKYLSFYWLKLLIFSVEKKIEKKKYHSRLYFSATTLKYPNLHQRIHNLNICLWISEHLLFFKFFLDFDH